MRISILLVIIFIPIALFGQEEDTTFLSRCSIGISISPDVAGRTIFVNTDDDKMKEVADEFREIDKPFIAYTFGLGMNYSVTNHFSVETGLLFSNKGFGTKKVEMSELYFGDMIDPRYGYVYEVQPGSHSGSIESVRFVHNYYYLDVPFRIYYTAGQDRLRFVGGVGITANFLLEAKHSAIYVYTNGERERITRDEQYDFAKFNVSPSISAGVDYKLNHQFNIKLVPYFSYGLIKIIDSPISSRLWSTGLNFSVFYNLK